MLMSTSGRSLPPRQCRHPRLQVSLTRGIGHRVITLTSTTAYTETIVSLLTQSLAARTVNGEAQEKGNTVSILAAGPYPSEQTTRPNYFFQFMALNVETSVKEYGISFTMDAET